MKRFYPVAVSLVWCMAIATGVYGATNPELTSKIRAETDRQYSSLFQLYRELHQRPELSFQERETSRRMATELKNAGFTVTHGLATNGVVGVLKNGEGPVILLRTDLDALPVKEQTGLPYTSTNRMPDEKGELVDVMHACGHDIHMTVFTGTARLLSQLKDQWRGTLVMIGQPAEERGGGARGMLRDGLFTRFPKPSRCLALHVNANLPAGTVGTVEGYALANVDSVDITIHGVGGHGAWPHLTKDPIVMAAEMIMGFQTIVSREIKPGEPAVVTVGSIHGGTKHNIIPAEVQLQLTLRSYTDEVREQILAGVRRIAKSTALGAGMPEDRAPMIALKNEFTPATYNQPELTRQLAAVFKQVLGADKVVTETPVMGGEDFSEYGRTPDKIPICMFWLGSIEPDRVEAAKKSGASLPSLHSPFYRPAPETTIKTGVLTMTSAALELLK